MSADWWDQEWAEGLREFPVLHPRRLGQHQTFVEQVRQTLDAHGLQDVPAYAQPLDPPRVSMTPEVEQKLAAAPLDDPLFPDFEPGFPIMDRMVREVLAREEALWRDALGRLLADLPAETPEQESRMARVLMAADRYAGIYRISLDEALQLFDRLSDPERKR